MSDTNYKSFVKGIAIVPKSTSANSLSGDLEVLLSDNKIRFHNGSINDPIVSETVASQGSNRLKNKDLEADSTKIVDGSDTSKKVAIDASGATTSTTLTLSAAQTSDRTLTLPDATDTLVARNTTDTLTNKTISTASNTISGLTNSNLSGTAAITNANLATMSNNTVKANISGSTSTPSDVSAVTSSTADTFVIRDSNAKVSSKGLILDGSTSGTLTINPAATTTSYSLIAPGAQGGTSTTLSNDGSGNLSWAAILSNPMTTGGDTIYGGASGTPTRLANGSSGQVLTSSGGTSAPTWANPGAMVLIQTQTASSSASIYFTSGISSTYDQYVVICSGVVSATNNVNFNVRFYDGASFISSANYSWYFEYSQGGGAPTKASTLGDTTCTLTGNISNSSTFAATFDVRFYTPSSTAYLKNLQWDGVFVNNASSMQVVDGSAVMNLTTAVSGIQFYMSSGNIATGTFSLYGIKK